MAKNKKRVARPITEQEISDYKSGMSVREISEYSDLSPSALSSKLGAIGIIRNKSDAKILSDGKEVSISSSSLLTDKENGSSYAAELSQSWIRRPLGVTV